MVTYAATLDVPRPVVDYLARLLAAHRRRIGTPKGSRVLGCFRQAVLVLRWFRERGCVHCLARNAGVSQATGYRYLHEGIDVLAGQAPELHEVLTRCRRDGCSHVVLDGILIPTERLASTTEAGNDWWYSGKHRTFGGNIQVLAAPDGTPLWTSDVEPGSVHDMAAARTHALPTLYWAASQLHLPTLADAGYHGAGAGVHTPVIKPAGRPYHALHVDNRTYNQLLRGLRALSERAAAELTQRWRTLHYITLSPSRIGDIARAAVVLNNRWK
ncbi:MAG TPA: transposase family protein [Chloroflexota bacterium]|nr:transposase family protein [Chloroflexota bacterium]